MNEEEIQRSIELLRERRRHLGEIREYRPQRGGKKSATSSMPDRDVADIFSNMIQPAEEAGTEIPTPSEEGGGS